jgi:hypothetical protein
LEAEFRFPASKIPWTFPSVFRLISRIARLSNRH